MPNPRYPEPKERPRVTPPHMALRDVRTAVGITLEGLAQRIKEVSGMEVSRGTLSAIENGHRGASQELLAAIALAFGCGSGAVTTSYEPRTRAA